MSTFPRWLVIVGQSGSGKGTAANVLKTMFESNGIPTLSISTGDEIRRFIASQTHTAIEMKKVDDRGYRQPSLFAATLWLKKIMEQFSGNEIILHEGSPRSVEELDLMLSLQSAGYFKPLRIVEVISSDEECKSRLIERTKLDKRLDLSKEGQPGEPDYEKIKNKLSWWTGIRGAIIRACESADCYSSILNQGTKEEFEQRVQSLFNIVSV